MEKQMFKPVPRSWTCPRWRRTSWGSGSASTSSRRPSSSAQDGRSTSSMRVRPRPTASPASTMCWRGPSRTCSRATRSCAASTCLAPRRLGHPRAAGGDRGREEARLHGQAADRGIRHRPVQRGVPQVGL